MSKIYESAISLIDEKEYKKAIEQLQSIDKNYSKYAEVKEKLKEVEQLYLNEYLSKSDEYLKEKKYDKAIKVLDEIYTELQNSDLVKDKRIEIKIAKLNDDIAELENKKEEAIIIIECIVEYDNEKSNKIEKAKEELLTKYKSTFLLETRTLMTTDYSKAKQNITKIQELLPKDEDIKQLVNEFNKIEPSAVSLLTLTGKPKRKTNYIK